LFFGLCWPIASDFKVDQLDFKFGQLILNLAIGLANTFSGPELALGSNIIRNKI